MIDQHPITPSPELVTKWWSKCTATSLNNLIEQLCTRAAQWGADQELDACCIWITREKSVIAGGELRAARRPKPLSLKELALESVKRFESGQDLMGDLDTIRQALEQLND